MTRNPKSVEALDPAGKRHEYSELQLLLKQGSPLPTPELGALLPPGHDPVVHFNEDSETYYFYALPPGWAVVERGTLNKVDHKPRDTKPW